MTNGSKGEDGRPNPPFDPQETQGQPGIEAKLDPRPQYEGRGYRAAGKLIDEVALVTGGDSGIGRAVATLFAREGADVAILCLPEENADAEETLRAIEAAGRNGIIITGDITEYAFCEEAVRQVLARFGRLNILVNNAAYQQHVESIEELSIEQWDRTFRTNIYGYFYMAKAVVGHLGRGDCIINTGSVTGLRGSPGLLDYSATKGAIHTFSKSLAANLVERGIRVNCVAPGPVWTPLNPAERSDEEIERFGANVPFGRPAQPEEIAPTFVYLASGADSGYITGETVALLGGEITAGS